MRSFSNSEHRLVLKWTPEEEVRKSFLFLGLLQRRETLCDRIFTHRGFSFTENEGIMLYFWNVMSYSIFPMTFPISACPSLAFLISRILPLWVLLGNVYLQLVVLEIFYSSLSPQHFRLSAFALRGMHLNTCICSFPEPFNTCRSLDMTMVKNWGVVTGAKPWKPEVRDSSRRGVIA